MGKKELIYEYGNCNLASAHLTNSSGVVIHYIDDYNEKILCSIVSGDRVISSHYVKLHYNGSFRINGMYFNIGNFIRSNF